MKNFLSPHFHPADFIPDDQRAQMANEHFDFGKLRHDNRAGRGGELAGHQRADGLAHDDLLQIVRLEQVKDNDGHLVVHAQ